MSEKVDVQTRSDDSRARLEVTGTVRGRVASRSEKIPAHPDKSTTERSKIDGRKS